jgi:hypothetical protein
METAHNNSHVYYFIVCLYLLSYEISRSSVQQAKGLLTLRYQLCQTFRNVERDVYPVELKDYQRQNGLKQVISANEVVSSNPMEVALGGLVVP